MQSIEPLHTVKRASRLVERTAPCVFLEFMTAGKHPATLTDTIFSLSHRDLARCCSQCNGITEKQRYKCLLKIVTGLPWESFQFLIFCVVVSRSSLPSARFLIMRSCARSVAMAAKGKTRRHSQLCQRGEFWHVSVSERQRLRLCGQNILLGLRKPVPAPTAKVRNRAMAANGTTKALVSPPPWWVSAQL